MQRDHNESSTWQELCRTAKTVRTGAPLQTDDASTPLPRTTWLRRSGLGGALVIAATLSALHVGGSAPRDAAADGSADSALFSLTNQDRASNGVPSVTSNAALQGVGEGTPYAICGGTANGRALDMIQLNYFSHQIPSCGSYVWPMFSEAGVKFGSAGENIGWMNGQSGAQAAATYINNAFMNSPEHRDNILNSSYTDLGVGSANSGAATWSGAGSYQDVWMFAEEFAQISGHASAPAPTASRAPAAAPRTSSVPVQRNSPAPPPPSQAPVVTAPPPSAPPQPQAAPTPPPAPSAAPTDDPAVAPPIWQGSGLLSDSVESLLESYLVN